MHLLFNFWLAINVAFWFIYFTFPLLGVILDNPALILAATVGIYTEGIFLLGFNIAMGLWGTYVYIQNAAEQLFRANMQKDPIVYIKKKGNPSKWRILWGVLLIAFTYAFVALFGIFVVSFFRALKMTGI